MLTSYEEHVAWFCSCCQEQGCLLSYGPHAFDWVPFPASTTFPANFIITFNIILN